MKTHSLLLTSLAVLTPVLRAAAAVLYVDVNGTNSTAPYANWATAATNIQQAINAATNGDVVLVNDGIYGSGSSVANGPNRVVVNKPVTVQSANGAAATIIDGGQAMRCVYLANGAVLSGFTLTNGSTGGGGGGAFCESTNVTISNCFLFGNFTSSDGAGTFQGTLYNCALEGNTVDWGSSGSGGGAMGAVLNDCTLTNNRSSLFGRGGGAHSSVLNHCVLAGNGSFEGGGGAEACTLNNCTLSDNAILFLGNGGGAESSTLYNCVVNGNSGDYGGGVSDCTLSGCALSGNVSSGNGGGASSSTLNHCTLVANSASGSGGGTADCTSSNCIIVYNTAYDQPNYSGGTLNFCCTAPLPSSGANNLAAEPQLADLQHVAPSSPCLGAGNAASTIGTDLDGEAWNNPPAIGCDEPHPGGATGALSAVIQTLFTNVAPGFALDFTGVIGGHAGSNIWSFGDATGLTNRLFVSHSWVAPGDYPVMLTVYNDDHPSGVTATVLIHIADQSIYYVWQNGTNPVAPYATWETAATNIQDAVDVAEVGATVLVSNGVYRAGGRTVHELTQSNRVAVAQPLIVRSVNGPEVTAIEGYQTPGVLDYTGVRCVYLTNSASLIGFTVTNGATQPGNDQDGRETMGGGVWCESVGAVVSNCIISGCAAFSGGGIINGTVTDCVLTNNSAYYGGGAEGGIFYHCVFDANFAIFEGYGSGGGADSAILYDCTFRFNSSDSGGGANSCTLNRCLVCSNSASGAGGGVSGGTASSCRLWENTAPAGGGANGSTLTNCVLSNNSAQSGGGANQSLLSDCVLTNNIGGSGGGGGGGVNLSTLERCVLANNYGGGYGGGANSSILANCLLTGNSVSSLGGGAADSDLTQCTIYGNSSAESGGGVSHSTVRNSIVYGNGDNYFESTLSYCCTVPLPVDGFDNFTNDPVFVDATGGNFRLQASSPCINAANNRDVSSAEDLDQNPRIRSSAPDVGAYETQSPSSALSYAWLAQYGLPTDGSADFSDPDGDGYNNLQEWIAGTNPTNSLSVLRLLSISNDLTLSWTSAPDRFYTVERSTNFGPAPTFTVIATDISGQTNFTTFQDPETAGHDRCFYRVSVQR